MDLPGWLLAFATFAILLPPAVSAGLNITRRKPAYPQMAALAILETCLAGSAIAMFAAYVLLQIVSGSDFTWPTVTSEFK